MKLRQIFAKREAAPKGAAGDSRLAPISGVSYSSRAINVCSQGQALSVSSWYRAFDVLAGTMGQLVLEYQAKNNKAHGGNYETDLKTREGKKLNYLFQVRPNPMMTASQFWAQLTLNRAIEGNAVAYIERGNDGEVSSIWCCYSATLHTNSMQYTVSYDRPGGPRTITCSDYDVIHWRNTFSNDHGLTGISTLKCAAQALSVAATNDRQAKDIAAKGGKMKLLLTEEQRPDMQINLLNKEQKEKQRDNLQQSIDENADVMLLSGMMKANIISGDAQGQQLLESRKHDNVVISRYTGVPLVLLMDYTNNTYKAPEQAMQAFLQHTISPMANSLELEINSKIIGMSGWPELRFHFNDKSLMRLDPMGKANLGKVLLETGIKCVNELRADNDLPSVKGGDRHVVSANLQPLDDMKVVGGQLEKGGEA